MANKVFLLRVSTEDEHIGLNISEHDAKTEILDLSEFISGPFHSQLLRAQD